MGTDIACFAEVRDGGAWRLAEPLAPNPYWFEDLADEDFPPDGEVPDDELRMAPQRLFETRNYDLFAILANVRNPMRAVEPFRIISKPRGFPEDACPEMRSYYEVHKYDAHDASWLTLAEIVEFDWNQRINRRGVVDKRAAHLFKPGQVGFPYDKWPAGLTISVSDFRGIDGLKIRSRGVEVEWIETYKEAVGPEVFEEIIPTLNSYGAPDAVRIAFWFHS